MRLSVIALDYDGTITQHDTLDPAVRAAIAEARTRGIVVLLVTGRILDELRRVAGDLHFVDGVVAENGAVVHFPGSGHTSPLAVAAVEPLVAELRRRGVRAAAGHAIVDAPAADAQRILEMIRQQELPLVLAFNRSRLMVLPQGVSKATGLQVALTTLRLSPRNAVAIGDAENDHVMLQLAEVGVAVEWGSKALRAAADVTLAGTGPVAVAGYIRSLAASARLPTPPRARRRLRLGYTEDGREFSLAVRGRNVLIAGDARSGKSWLAGLLAEQLILHGYALCVLDPEGDYGALEELPGVTVLGGEEPPPTPRDLLRALRYPDRSVVIDLSRAPHDAKIAYIRAALPALAVMRRRTGLPHRILLDEAHYFLYDAGAEHLLDLDTNGYTIVTHYASRLPPELLAATEVMLVTCESNPAEIDELWRWCAASHAGEHARSHWSVLSRLTPGQAIALPITEESRGELTMFTIGPRLTPHVRHRHKYVDVPVRDERAFAFTSNGASPARARTLREFVAAVEHAPPATLAGYARRGDFSRWIADVFGDHALAGELRVRERRFREAGDADAFAEIAAAIRARYDLLEHEVETVQERELNSTTTQEED